MDELVWTNERLTDGTVSVKLSNLPQDKTYKKVDFSDNKLQSIPNFNQHNQFGCLEELRLSDNNIVNVDTERLPHNIKLLSVSTNKISELPDFSKYLKLEGLWVAENRMRSFNPNNLPANIQVLNLAANKFSDMPDVSQCHSLTSLSLLGNQITDLDPNKLPSNIEVLRMDDNKLSVLTDFSRHKQLKKMTLTGNQIMKIYDINRDIQSWDIDTFDEKFFENKTGYNQLLASHLNTEGLRHPPPEVFARGLNSIQAYFKDMVLSKRVKHSRKRFYKMSLELKFLTNMYITIYTK